MSHFDGSASGSGQDLSPWQKYYGLKCGLITSGINYDHLEKASRQPLGYIHMELEDGVAHSHKAEARDNIIRALRTFDWSGTLTLVRVNGVQTGMIEDDIASVSAGVPSAFLVAKCQGPEDIHYADELITRAEERHGIPSGTIKLASMVERIRAFQLIDEIATASPRMIALYIGATDLSTEIGYRRTWDGDELETYGARFRVIVAAHGAGLLALDSSTPRYHDLELTYRQARWAYQIGFDAKSCISPRQVETVNRAFSPTDDEVTWAEEVVAGKDEVGEDGAIWVKNGMFIDEAMIARATGILQAAGKLSA